MEKRAIMNKLKFILQFKKDVYEKCMQLAKKPLPDYYQQRLLYEQREVSDLLEHLVGPEGIWCNKILVVEENLNMHWDAIEELIFPKSRLTWMEHIFGPIFPLFKNQELNDFVLEWHGQDREALIGLFLHHNEVWNYCWMNYYRQVVKNPQDYESDCEFPVLPPKLPKCLGHLRGCNNRSYHFCQQCVLWSQNLCAT